MQGVCIDSEHTVGMLSSAEKKPSAATRRERINDGLWSEGVSRSGAWCMICWKGKGRMAMADRAKPGRGEGGEDERTGEAWRPLYGMAEWGGAWPPESDRFHRWSHGLPRSHCSSPLLLGAMEFR